MKTWSVGEVLRATDLNGNFSECVSTSSPKTITAAHTWSATQAFQGATFGAAVVVSAGITATTGAFSDAVTVTTASATSTIAFIGTTAPSAGLTSGRSAGTNVAVSNEGASPRLFVVTAKNGNAAATPRLILTSFNGTMASPTVTASGDVIGIFEYTGYDGTTIGADGAIITATATQTWSGTQRGTKLEFAVTANGSTSTATALTLNQDSTAVFASSIKTSAPSGGTAAAWKLGTVAVVAPTSPNRTIELDVGGTIYYLAAKTTNN